MEQVQDRRPALPRRRGHPEEARTSSSRGRGWRAPCATRSRTDVHPHEFPKFQEQIGQFATLRDMINWCIEKPNEGVKIDAGLPRHEGARGVHLLVEPGHRSSIREGTEPAARVRDGAGAASRPRRPLPASASSAWPRPPWGSGSAGLGGRGRRAPPRRDAGRRSRSSASTVPVLRAAARHDQRRQGPDRRGDGAPDDARPPHHERPGRERGRPDPVEGDVPLHARRTARVYLAFQARMHERHLGGHRRRPSATATAAGPPRARSRSPPDAGGCTGTAPARRGGRAAKTSPGRSSASPSWWSAARSAAARSSTRR